MAITVNSLFDKRSNQIQEILNKNIEVLTPGFDPVWRDTIATSLSAIPVQQIGRDLKIIRLFQMGMSGVLEQAAPRGDLPLYGDLFQPLDAPNASHLMVSQQAFSGGALQTFPDAMEDPESMTFRLGISLRAMMGNMKMHMSHLQAEATPAFIGQILAPKMEGFARNISQTVCNYWYVDQNTNYRLGLLGTPTIAAVTGVEGATSTLYGITFALDNLAIDRVNVGMRVDFYSVSGSAIVLRRNDQQAAAANQTTATRVAAYVTRVDEMAGTCTVITNTLPSGWPNGAPVAGDALIFANSAVSSSGAVSTGFAGINSWMKFGTAAGTSDTLDYLLGDEADTSNRINVTQHPQFKSFLKDHGGDLMTEHKLRLYVRAFNRAKARYGGYVDSLVASDGIWLGMESTKIGREILDRTGRLSSLGREGSEEGMKFTMDGRTITGYTSNFVESGTLYGLRMGGNNWKRLVPPSIPGTTGMDRDAFAPYEFVGGVLNSGSMKIPIFENVNGRNRLSEAVMMPGMLRMQLVPDYPCGMKITNIAENRVYSDLAG